MLVKLLLSLTEKIFACELPSIQPLAIHPCGIKICSTVHRHVTQQFHMAQEMGHRSGSFLGSGFTALLTPYLPSDKSLRSFTQLFHLLIYTFLLFILQSFHLNCGQSLTKVWPGTFSCLAPSHCLLCFLGK